MSRTKTRQIDPTEPLFNTTFRSSHPDEPTGLRERVHRWNASPLGDAEREGVFHFSSKPVNPGRWDLAGTSRFATDQYNGFDDPEDDWD